MTAVTLDTGAAASSVEASIAPYRGISASTAPITMSVSQGTAGTIDPTLAACMVEPSFTFSCPIDIIISCFSLNGWNDNLGWDDDKGWKD